MKSRNPAQMSETADELILDMLDRWTLDTIRGDERLGPAYQALIIAGDALYQYVHEEPRQATTGSWSTTREADVVFWQNRLLGRKQRTMWQRFKKKWGI